MTRASDTARLVSGGAVFNEASNDVDFRVESNGRTHALMVDAGNNSVLFGDLQTAQTNGGTNSSVQIEGTDATASLSIFRNGDNANGPAIFLGKSRGTSLGSNTVVQNGDELGKILFVAADGTDRAHSAGAIVCSMNDNAGSNDLPTRLSFFVATDSTTTLTERMRIGEENGAVMFGPNFNIDPVSTNNPGASIKTTQGNLQVCRDGGIVGSFNRSQDGDVIGIRSAGTQEGTISVSGSTVSYNGFSGLHESSGITTDTPIGTVVSTIDELDIYFAKQGEGEDESDNTKAGQTRADHAKVKVSDTVGDSAVYGVVGSFNPQGKVNVASVGIGSVRVTGACAKGDLLESNGDGTAKVQSDDIVRSKTIGKVTIGNSNTEVKLVSCVLYCG